MTGQTCAHSSPMFHSSHPYHPLIKPSNSEFAKMGNSSKLFLRSFSPPPRPTPTPHATNLHGYPQGTPTSNGQPMPCKPLPLSKSRFQDTSPAIPVVHMHGVKLLWNFTFSLTRHLSHTTNGRKIEEKKAM